MNQNYVHTITLYNRIRAADRQDKKEHWRRTILRNCFWKAATNTSFGDKEANVSNTYVVRIPQDARYVPYHAFVKSPDGHFTVSQAILSCMASAATRSPARQERRLRS